MSDSASKILLNYFLFQLFAACATRQVVQRKYITFSRNVWQTASMRSMHVSTCCWRQTSTIAPKKNASCKLENQETGWDIFDVRMGAEYRQQFRRCGFCKIRYCVVKFANWPQYRLETLRWEKYWKLSRKFKLLPDYYRGHDRYCPALQLPSVTLLVFISDVEESTLGRQHDVRTYPWWRCRQHSGEASIDIQRASIDDRQHSGFPKCLMGLGARKWLGVRGPRMLLF